jgi:hypothetical protein
MYWKSCSTELTERDKETIRKLYARINETKTRTNRPVFNCKVLILLGAVRAKMIFHGC